MTDNQPFRNPRDLFRKLNNDWHPVSTRPCPTCRPITEYLGEPFGCNRYAVEHPGDRHTWSPPPTRFDGEPLIAHLDRIKRSQREMTVDSIPFDMGVAASQDAIRSYFRGRRNAT